MSPPPDMPFSENLGQPVASAKQLLPENSSRRFRAGLKFIQWLSRRKYSTREGMANRLAKLYLALDPVSREILDTNLQLCLPDLTAEEHVELMHCNAKEAFLAMFIRFRTWSLDEQTLRHEVRLQGRSVLDRFMGKRPLVLLCPHFLSCETAIQRLTLEGPSVSVYAPAANPNFERFRQQARTRFGKQLALPLGSSMVPVIRHLRKGTPLFLLPDYDVGTQEGAVFSPFFGIPAATTRAPAWCATKAGALIVLVSVKRTHEDHHCVTLHEPLEGLSDDIQVCTDQINAAVEALIRANASQYWWLQPRFATRPEGEDPIYSAAALKRAGP
jgi:Kdo2-lipid IVA lauroyltransferase/acyltransferase